MESCLVWFLFGTHLSFYLREGLCWIFVPYKFSYGSNIEDDSWISKATQKNHFVYVILDYIKQVPGCESREFSRREAREGGRGGRKQEVAILWGAKSNFDEISKW